MIKMLGSLVLAGLCGTVVGQVLPSHVVNPDGTIAFHYKDAAAKVVALQIDTLLKPLPMQRDEGGTWSVTTPAMSEDIYGYSFVVDGTPKPDPLNSEVRPNFLYPTTEVSVEGATPEPWDLAAIPHGRVDMHHFGTHVALHMPQNQDAYVVYTPPSYDEKRKGGYPVLYLLHGFSDGETGWTEVGRAHNIMDRLIADGKAVPMIVVMPLGYGDLNFVLNGHGGWDNKNTVDTNVDLFQKSLMEEVIPAVEHEYNTARGRENRAIIGLSMGGLESLTIGLRNPDNFAWVGGLSSAMQQRGFDEKFPGLTPEKAKLRLLWVACGVDDKLVTPNREFVAWAKAKGLPVTAIETEGAHQWPVWRKNLIAFAPLLFRK